MTKLTFLGAARTVTGSKHLLEVDGRKILIDCGLFQGLKELRLRNWQPLPIDPADLSAVVLTHAHLDHTGYLPRLVAAGYRGRVFCTPGTCDLCKLVLPDSARLQEEDAREANRLHYSKHNPALPLYRESDAYRALSQLQPFGFNRPYSVVDGVDIEFVNAGHLLGSAFIKMAIRGGPRILFGGDLGRYSRPVLPDPSQPPDADVLLLESTYGDRVHEADDEGTRLAAIIKDTVARGGKLIIPAFAIGRVEEVLYWIKRLEDEGKIPQLPVFLDSPMALDALRYYATRATELDPDIQDRSRDPPIFHRALSAGYIGAAIFRAGEVENSIDCRLVERHGDRRPRALPLAGGIARHAQHGAVCRLPGCRHTGPVAHRWRPRSEDSGSACARQRTDRAPRLDVGPRRFCGNHAMALGVRDGPGDDLPRARRARADGRAQIDNRVAFAMESAHPRAPRASGVKLTGTVFSFQWLSVLKTED
jgi:Cft2 family RNA processing exonuclease